MYGINFIKEEILKKNKKLKISLRKDIQSLYEVAEELKSKKQKLEIYYAINHLNNVLKSNI